MSISSWTKVRLETLLRPINRKEPVDPMTTYTLLGARWYAKGLYTKEVKTGSTIKASHLYRVQTGDFVYNRLFAWKGSFAVASTENDGCYVSNEFPCFEVDRTQILPEFLWFFFRRETTWNSALGLSFGATPTSRNRLKEANLLSMTILIPPLDEQRRIVDRISSIVENVETATHISTQVDLQISRLAASLLDQQLPSQSNEFRLADVISPGSRVSYGVLVPGPEVDDGVPFIRIQDLDPESPPAKPAKRIAKAIDAQYARTRLTGNEVLVAVVGATIGKVGTVPQSWVGANVARAVCRIVPGPSIRREFLIATLQAPRVQNYFRDVTRTLAQPTLNVSQLLDTPISCPPLSVQDAILLRLQSLNARLASVRVTRHAALRKMHAVIPSLLDHAFRGSL